MKKAFCKMCVTICGRFHPDEGAVAGYGNRIRMKYTAKWGVQIAGMIFQTGSSNMTGRESKIQEDLKMDASSGMSMGFTIVWLVVLFGIMYFLMIRPQKKEQKRVQAMLSDMAVGDSIVTTSGFYGVIIDMTEEDVIVEFGNNKNCRIPMRKQAIAEVEKAEQASA